MVTPAPRLPPSQLKSQNAHSQWVPFAWEKL